jgi:hypothetical protein
MPQNLQKAPIKTSTLYSIVNINKKRLTNPAYNRHCHTDQAQVFANYTGKRIITSENKF